MVGIRRERNVKIAPHEVMAFAEFLELGAFSKDEGPKKSKRKSCKTRWGE